jgi:hypothetical protein
MEGDRGRRREREGGRVREGGRERGREREVGREGGRRWGENIILGRLTNNFSSSLWLEP